MALTLISHSSLPFQYWSYAFSTAIFLINRLPSLSRGSISPWQTLFGTSPNFSFFKSFGCACFPLLRPYSKNKFNLHSKECVFLGYASNSKGYLCLDPLTSRIYVSRHVVFNESHYPFSSSTSSCHQPSQSTPSSWLSNLLFFHPCQLSSVLGPTPQSSPSPSPRPTQSTASPLQNTLPSVLGPIPLSLNPPIISGPNLESLPITQPDSSTPHPNPYNTLSSSTSSALPNPIVPVHHTANSSPCFSILPNPTAPAHHTVSPPPSSILPNPTTTINPTATINPIPTLSFHPMQTWSKSGIVKKKCFAFSTTINYLETEPPNYTIASKIPEWRAAMASEFDALHRQHTWSLVPPCPN